ncbi:hypothetical protein AB4205_07820 [Vibrio sp. 10N.286.49.F3]|uniref:hypothetical protein n=1 Tax=unclassified Vibrio TaxID=2614977 RepID=UPI00354C7C55
MKVASKTLFIANAIFLSGYAFASSQVYVDLNVKHEVGGISEFDRSKYIVMHSKITEPDWEGEDIKLRYLLDNLDVYFGRDNGTMPLHATMVEQDPNRPGYADPQSMAELGESHRIKNYGEKLARHHQYDDRFEAMIGGQIHQFWIGEHKGKGGWTFKNTDAVGEFMGRFLNNFYREEGELPAKGHKRPKYVEILNEPLYELVTVHGNDPVDTFIYHNEVAESFRKYVDDDSVMIGGYTTAFPWFDDRNFKRWDERMKLFIDTSGEYMDFMSIHLYDFGYLGRDGGEVNFRGGRIEATMDMMEQYQYLKLGEVKPFMISEYGGRDHKTEKETWSARNDWQTMKSFSPMMIQFMAKPDQILKAIPFSLTKAEWHGEEGRNYPWRLMRHNDEKKGEIGSHYVYTDIIKFYELWSEVNGTRVDTKSVDKDVLVDSYVDGKKAYVAVSNLLNKPAEVSVNLVNVQGAEFESLKIKHLHNVDGDITLTETSYNEMPDKIAIHPEASMIFEYVFKNPIEIEEKSVERKYYATSYHQAIKANESINFNINDVQTNEFGAAVLRMSFGRQHRSSKEPIVTFNGTKLDLPVKYSGDDQKNRPQFFNMLEIDVPNSLLRQNNKIAITFPDQGGFVTSTTLQTFEYSSDILKLDKR